MSPTAPSGHGQSSTDSRQSASDVRGPWLGDPRRCITADCLLLALALGAVAICLLGAHSATRLLLVLAATCVIPGGAVLTRLPMEDLLEAFGLAVGLGFTIEAVGALAMIWTGWWHPFGWAVVLISAACLVFAFDLRRNVLIIKGSR
jgi:hypothetical protein